MRWFVAVWCVAAPAAAQQPVPPTPPGPPAESARVDSVRPPPPPPTPEQQKFLQGLRVAWRGVAQLKDGVDRVGRTQGSRDSLKQREAGRRLAGLCHAARGFLTTGRASLRPTVYDLPIRTSAKQLALQVDSLLAYLPTCERQAAKAPPPTAAVLVNLLRSSETALRAFRTDIGLPNK